MVTPSWLPMIVFFLLLAVVILTVYLVTQDARLRGFSELQIYFMRVAGVLFFPTSIIVYLLFRPALRPRPESC